MGEKTTSFVIVLGFCAWATIGYLIGFRKGAQYERAYRANAVQWQTNEVQIWMKSQHIGSDSERYERGAK